jgi:hypothetical protein
VVRPPRLQMGMRRGERKRSSAGGRCTALRSPESSVSASRRPVAAGNGVPYSQTLTASWRTSPYMSVVSGAPPNGIALSPSAGVLSGRHCAELNFYA